MSRKDDNELVFEVIHGSISSFEVLIDRYQTTIFNILLRMVSDQETAKDLTQDVFVKVFENLGKFNFNFRFFSWLYRIAINEAINFNRKKPRNVSLSVVEPFLNEKEEQNREAGNKLVNLVIKNMADEYRILILLKYYCGLSYEEISEVINLPVKKVRSRLYMARENMRKELIDKGFFEND